MSLTWSRIPVQGTIYRRLRIGRDGHLNQSQAYDIYRSLYENTSHVWFVDASNRVKSIFLLHLHIIID